MSRPAGAAGAPSLQASGSQVGGDPPKKKVRRGAPKKHQQQALLPALAAFLMLDNNDSVVEAELVEEYVRRYMAWPEAKQERLAEQLMACMDTGNVVVVRAVMLATLEQHGWTGGAARVSPKHDDVIESSVPPSPEGRLPPGAMPVQT